ncbi:methylated-DNA--[protein]-cysteine S-methyltransferase [Zavarzinia compransoris]|uniref:methylated-DNA--[protein]-cysteine S-methyltransferase n=1 Tax=Zavarzinia compransoris TaxID=1264899 RepID=A0A317E394_9PROT|nr:methylated-DNA--[protein]-cysteine S-methyltransferase [Zavarzinia compransoris]PWR20650.1 cysteine methyltransferase [Zavarzinia compransoris]TDP44530.1 methylated-DNA-[protein]-cysteine S-methyltransferase [Zavarzinia compransoris]
MAEARVETPIGRFHVTVRADAVVAAGWAPSGDAASGDGDDMLLALALGQVEDYFAGRRRQFDLPIAPHGTPFQRKVWRRIAAIPFGAFETYGSLARTLGGVAAQAVGQACGRNPVGLLVPCHRVLAAGPKLGGYGGSETVKRWLLSHEGIEVPG